jgi:hypothetical protein
MTTILPVVFHHGATEVGCLRSAEVHLTYCKSRHHFTDTLYLSVVIGFVIRSIWRVIILTLGIGLAYVSTFVAFPYLDKRLPFFIALIIVYIAIAYFALPALIRTLRLVVRPNHIPLYATTADGLPSDPVNIAVVTKSRRHFVHEMKKAGWFVSDKATLRNALREGYAILFDKPYPNAPFSPMYLFNRHFDIGFQMPHKPGGSPRHRHHVRFWQLVDRREDHGHFRFWAKHFRHFIRRDKTIWIGAATDDVNIFAIRWYNLQITHSTHPLHHRERDFLIESLEQAGGVKNISDVKAGEPFEIHSQQVGVSFVCDGRLSIVELKK